MILLWWLLIVLLIVLLMVLFKAKEVRHKISLIAIVGIFLFLIFSFIQIYQSHKADLTTFDGIVKAGKIYVSWLGQLFGNIGKTVGFAVKQDWGINSTQINTLK